MSMPSEGNSGEAIAGGITRKAVEEAKNLPRMMREDKFVKKDIPPLVTNDDIDKLSAEDKSAVLKNGWNDTTNYVKRESFIQEFFAYETIGATIPHVMSIVQTDDPALMEALHKAEQEGRVVYDKDGSIIDIRDGGKPYDGTEPWTVPKEVAEASIELAKEISKEISDAMPALSQGNMIITAHGTNPDGSEYVSMVFPGCQKVPDPKSGFEDDDVQPIIVTDKT